MKSYWTLESCCQWLMDSCWYLVTSCQRYQRKCKGGCSGPDGTRGPAFSIEAVLSKAFKLEISSAGGKSQERALPARKGSQKRKTLGCTEFCCGIILAILVGNFSLLALQTLVFANFEIFGICNFEILF